MIDILAQSPARPILLKLQAVNFTSTVADTADLRTMRGSSLALLRGPAVLADKLTGSLPHAVGVNVVYQGASEVLIELWPMAGAAEADADDSHRSTGANKADDPIQPYGGKNKGAWLKAIRPWTSKLSPSNLEEQVEKCLRHLAKNPRNLQRGGETLTAEELSRQFRWIMDQEQTKADLATAQSLGEARLQDWCEALAEHARRLVAEPAAGYPLDLFTFVAAAASMGTGEKWPVVLARLDSRIGAEQHRQLTLSLSWEAGVLRPASSAVCALTRTHPSGQQKVQGMPVSASVARRRRSGRHQKQHFYEEQLGHCAVIAEMIADKAAEARLSTCRAALAAEEDIGFTHSFADIVGAPPDGLAPNVRGKLAVVYLDGNNLGKRRQAAAQTLDGLRRFSAELTVAQGGLLAAIVDWLLATSGMRNDEALDVEAGEADRRFRFETLLWGGDEMAFVLPAWHGFSFVSILLDAIGTMRLPSDDAAVTHGLGVVFASAKSPIGGLLDAAEQLAGAAKAKTPDGRSVERNDVQLLALEGIDRAALDVMALRGAYFQRPSIPPEHFSIAGETWAAACAAMRHADDRGCRTQLHRLMRQAIDAGALGCGPDETSARALRDRLCELGMAEVDDELLRSGVLARGSASQPFIPVWHYLTLADYALAEPRS